MDEYAKASALGGTAVGTTFLMGQLWFLGLAVLVVGLAIFTVRWTWRRNRLLSDR
jgi:hypothetical protein